MVRKTLYEIKSLWKCLLVMGIISWVVLPVINLYQMKDVPVELSLGGVLTQAQLFLPLVIAIPCGILLRQFFDEGISELIHTMPLLQRKGPLSILLFQLLCQLFAFPVFLWYYHCYGLFLWQELLRTVIQAFFLQNLAYAAAYLTHLPIAGIAAQILAAGLMQMLIFNPNGEELLISHVTIYAKISVLAPRPWNLLQLILTAVSGMVFHGVGVRRTRCYYS